MMSKKQEKYSVGIRIFHWLTSACVFTLLIVGWYMTSLEESVPNKYSFFNFHESLGIVVLVVTASRVFLKFKSNQLELPSHLGPYEKKLANSVHFLLYGLLFLMPLTGILMTLLGGYKVPFFIFEFPNIFPTNKNASKFFENTHGIFAYTIAALIGFHILGILKELILKKKNLLKRMI